jgi:hypothetical protein
MASEQEERERLRYLELKRKMAMAQQPAQPQAQPAAEEPGVLGTALDYGMRALDYAGGLTRTAAAAPFGVVQGEDVMAALKGKAPSTSEYLEEAGVGAGASLSDIAPSLYSETGQGLALEKGGMFDPTQRGLLGFVGDVALDPATYLSGGLSAAAKAGKLGKVGRAVSRPVSAVTEPIGKKLFKSGVKELDEVAIQKGKKPVSEVLMEYDVMGSKKQIADKATDLSNDLFEQREGILQMADRSGGSVDFNKIMQPFIEKAKAALKDPDPAVQDVGRSMLGTVRRYADAGTVSIQKASQMKTNLYHRLPDNTWDIMKNTPDGNKFLAEMASGIRGSVEEAVEKSTGQGGLLNKVNDDLGTLLTTRKVMGKEAGKEIRRPYISAIDGMILSSTHPHVILGKKAAEIGKSAKFRTKMGSRLMGKKTPVQTVTQPIEKRGLIDLLREEEQ